MSLPLRRTCALLVLSLVALVPASAHAMPLVLVPTPTVLDVQADALPGAATQVTLTADQDIEANHSFTITTQPAHGSVVLADQNACTYANDGSHTRCTIVATYTSDAGFTGTDTFTYIAVDTTDHGSQAGTVTMHVAAPTPPFIPVPPATKAPVPGVTGSEMASVGSDWIGSADHLLPGATVDYGDLSGPEALATSAGGASILRHVYGSSRTYTVTVTNHGDAGAVASATFPVKVLAVTPATPSQVTVPPNTVGVLASPGLYVNVISGAIIVKASGSATFAPGQFGFTPSFTQPPVILPMNPGIRFTPPPTFAPATVLSSTQLTFSGADPKTTATIEVAYTKKMYCNSRGTGRAGSVDCIVRSLQSNAAEAVTPELWYIAANGTLQPVVSSTRPGAASGVNAKSGVITMTLDATSTPTLASLARTTSFAALVRKQGAPVSALRRTGAARAVRWPARTTISTGVVFTCPAISKRGCSVRLRATSSQFGVHRIVGSRTVHVRAGATAPLDFTLARPGRWRLATRGLVATLSADAVAWQPKATREHRSFAVRVKLPH